MNNPWVSDFDFVIFSLVVGYTLTVAIEIPILFALLSPSHSRKSKLIAGFFLTACSYPLVVFVMPRIFNPLVEGLLYKSVTETIVPIVECAVFWLLFTRRQKILAAISKRMLVRDFAAITLANLCSFGLGEVLNRMV